MVQELTKAGNDDVPLVRPKSIEAQIDAALRLTTSGLGGLSHRLEER